MREAMYCEKCGNVYLILFSKKCNFCGTKMQLLPEQLKNKYNIFNDSWMELWSELDKTSRMDKQLKIMEEMLARKHEFVKNELFDNPIFSFEEYDKLIQKERETNQRLAAFDEQQANKQISKNIARAKKESYTPKCPICGSTNLSKISTTSRVAKTAVFGALGAIDDAGKTYRCGSCGSKF